MAWTERIAKLTGIDAPAKSENWQPGTWQEMAKSAGVPEDEVLVAMAKQTITVLKEIRVRNPELARELQQELESPVIEEEQPADEVSNPQISPGA